MPGNSGTCGAYPPPSFYNPSVRVLRAVALTSLIAAVPALAQAARSAATPHEYALPPDKLAQAKAFAFIGNVLYLVSIVATLIVLALLIRFRAGAALRNWAARVLRRPAAAFLLCAASLLLIFTLIDLPLDIWGHSVSRRFGISIERWPAWLWDWTKGELISLVVGVALVAGFYWIVWRSPRHWWFWVWL